MAFSPAIRLLARSVLRHPSMKNTDDTADGPIFTFNHRPMPARHDDPARRRLGVLERRCKDEARWADADLLGWLADDLDRLPAPWGRVVRLLLA